MENKILERETRKQTMTPKRRRKMKNRSILELYLSMRRLVKPEPVPPPNEWKRRKPWVMFKKPF